MATSSQQRSSLLAWSGFLHYLRTSLAQETSHPISNFPSCPGRCSMSEEIAILKLPHLTFLSRLRSPPTLENHQKRETNAADQRAPRYSKAAPSDVLAPAEWFCRAVGDFNYEGRSSSHTEIVGRNTEPVPARCIPSYLGVS